MMSNRQASSLNNGRKRKIEERRAGNTVRPKKRIRKQKEYHSSSEDEDSGSEAGFTPVNLGDSEEDEEASVKETQAGGDFEEGEDDTDHSGSDQTESQSEEEEESNEFDVEPSKESTRKHLSKRNDPEAFSTSISKILATKLSQSVRKDPVLSRSREAIEARKDIANERLEKKAKAKLRADKKEDLDRDRVKDVLGLNTGEAGETAEEEKRLRKIAQRGCVKLFNAVRAAQVRAEEAAREERRKGTVGFANREEKINEVSKQGFLDLINGKKKRTAAVET